jgi:acetylornithine deacetylase/succinyl-diaminopimelate desuccinylase-like protein
MKGGVLRGVVGALFDAADRSFDDHLDVIRRYLRQPSISVSGEGIAQCAEMTAELIEWAGGSAEIVHTPGHPVVLGRIGDGAPRLLRYGMYDVQPVDEEGWLSDPFAADIRSLEGVGPAVVARGAANSKACLAAFLCAMRLMRDDLPATITFLIDGEEELGSANLPEVVRARRDYLTADAGFDLDLHADTEGVPDVYLGVKGVLSVRLSCEGGDWGGPVGKALHSSNGVFISSPAWSLVRALDALVGPGEEPRIDLRSGTIPPEDLPLLEELAAGFDMRAELASCNSLSAKISDPRAAVEALVYAPTININGLQGGAPQGSKTIIPERVQAALDLRLPYGCDVDQVKAQVREAVAAAAPEVEVEIYETCPPAKTSADSPVARSMIASHADVGPPARVWPSAPWWAPYYLFEQELRIPFVQGGAGHSAGAHASNEYASIDGLRAHIKQSMAFVHRYSEEVAR